MTNEWKAVTWRRGKCHMSKGRSIAFTSPALEVLQTESISGGVFLFQAAMSSTSSSVMGRHIYQAFNHSDGLTRRLQIHHHRARIFAMHTPTYMFVMNGQDREFLSTFIQLRQSLQDGSRTLRTKANYRRLFAGPKGRKGSGLGGKLIHLAPAIVHETYEPCELDT